MAQLSKEATRNKKHAIFDFPGQAIGRQPIYKYVHTSSRLLHPHNTPTPVPGERKPPGFTYPQIYP